MKSRRFVVAGDNHGSEIDPVCEKAFFSWLADWKPEIRIHSGDLLDLAALRNGASQEEKAQSMADDYKQGMDFAKRMFKGGTVKHFLRGNHDERLWDLLHKSEGVLRDFADQKTREIESLLKSWGVNMLPYDARLGVLRIGKMQVVHGYKSGINCTRQHAIIYGNVFHGHDHSQGIAPTENIDGPSLAMGTGCLCRIDMPYNSRQTNKLRHQQGWIYGNLYEDGTYQAFQAKRVGNVFNLASEIKTY